MSYPNQPYQPQFQQYPPQGPPQQPYYPPPGYQPQPQFQAPPQQAATADADDLVFGGGIPIAKFEKGAYGTVHAGVIVAKGTSQKRNFKTQQPEFYEDGKPNMQVVITLQTNERDPEIQFDDGRRRIFFSPSSKSTLAAAIKSTGGKSIEIGAYLTMTYTHDEQGKGSEPKKVFSIQYQPPGGAQVDQAVMGQAPQQYQQAPQQPPPVPQPQFQAPQPQQPYQAPPPQAQQPQAQQPQYQQAPPVQQAQPPAQAPQADLTQQIPQAPAGLPPELLAQIAKLQQGGQV